MGKLRKLLDLDVSMLERSIVASFLGKSPVKQITKSCLTDVLIIVGFPYASGDKEKSRITPLPSLGGVKKEDSMMVMAIWIFL